MDVAVVIILLVFGILLLVAEMFLLPGFGIAGITGFGSLAASVVVAYCKLSATAGHVTLIGAVVLTGLAIFGFVKSKAFKKMSLDTTIDSKVELADPGKRMKEGSKTA